MTSDFIKVFLPSTLAFIVGIILAPFLTHYLYKYKMWKKRGGKMTLDGKDAVVFNELHKQKEVSAPRMGGVIIWVSSFLVIVGIWFLSRIYPIDLLKKLDFLSRSQTWIPLATLIFGGLFGLIDDYLEIKRSEKMVGGLSLTIRLLIVGIIGLLCALWFYFKLDIHSVGLPFGFNIELGLLFIPFFVLVVILLYSGGVIDGIDGLAGGIFASIFAAYAGIAYFQNQINLAAFSALVVGGILAFLWFNIPPARFYMSETGTMGLTVTLAVIAFMTDSLGGGYGVIVLPIIAMPLIITTFSNILQISSKKLRHGKKLFKIAPLHHHFEAIGWPSYKVTMRYWIIGVIFAIVGMILGIMA